MPDMFEDTPHDQSLADPLPDDPFGLLLRWMIEAQSSGLLNPDAMIVGTLDERRQSARANGAVPRRRQRRAVR